MSSWLDELSGHVSNEDDGSVTVTVGGVLHAATAAKLRSLLDEAVAARSPLVVLDMSGVSLLDAASLATLVTAARALAAVDARLEVRDVTPRIYEFIRLAGLVETLHVTRPAGLNRRMVAELSDLDAVAKSRAVLDASLQLVVTMAQAVVIGGDGVSITLPRQGKLGTVAASNDIVLHMDQDQYATAQGPCLDAATQGERFHIGSLREEQRWPAFVPRALARGIESIVSTPLMSDDAPVGALNIYSRTPAAFAAHEMQWADQFASETSAVLAVAAGDEPPQLRAHELQQALLSREVVHLAQGRIMERRRVSPAAAYRVLREASSTTGRPLRELSELIVNSPGDLPFLAEPLAEPRDGSPDARPAP